MFPINYMYICLNCQRDYIYNWKDLKKRLFMLIYPIISLLIFRGKKKSGQYSKMTKSLVSCDSS